MSNFTQNIDLSTPQKKRKAALFLTLVFGLFFLLVFLFTGLINSAPGNAPEFISKDGPVVLTGDNSIYEKLDTYQYTILREDLKYIAVNYINKYKKLDTEIVFEVSSTEDSDQLVISGKFTQDKTIYTTTIVRRPNSRLSNTVISGTEKIYKEELPSNSKRNNFIAVLPYENDDYIINYEAIKDSFVVSLYAIQAGENAISYIRLGVGESTVDDNVELLPLGDDNYERFIKDEESQRTGAEVVSEP